MVEYKLVSFVAVVALWTPVTLLIKLICLLLKWKYIHEKNHVILAAVCSESKAILSKKFCLVIRAGAFILEDFHLGRQDLGHKNWDLGNQASPVSYMNKSKFLRQRKMRRDLGNRASMVDQACMKIGPKLHVPYLYMYIYSDLSSIIYLTNFLI